MRRILQTSILIALLSSYGMSLEAQNAVYSQQFVNGVTYCPGSSQYDSWRTFRQSLDTSTRKFIAVTFNGSQNTTGITCNDAFATRRIAAALRSATATTVINCNGVDWEVGIGCQVTGGCVNTADGVVLSASGAGTNCACSNGANVYIIRAAIGNLNWGGINGPTCSAPTQTMTVTFFDPVPNEVLVTAITAPSGSCGSTNDSISATIESQSSTTLTNIPVTCVVSGTLGGSAFNQTYSTSIAGPLTSGQRANVRFANINTSQGANLNITVFTAQPGDPNRSNDTLRANRVMLGAPSAPTTTAGSRCGVGTVQLSATPASNQDSIFWYNTPTGGSFLGQGRNFTTPFLHQTTTFYASAARVYLPAASFFNSNTGGTVVSNQFSFFNGWAFDLTPNKNLTIDNIGVRSATTNTSEFRVYYRVGTHNGFVNNSNAWTLLGTRTGVQGNGPNNTNFLMLNIGGLELQANTVYGIYICTLGDETYARSGSLSNSNADMVIQGGHFVYGLFGTQGFGANWTMDVRFMYSGDCKSGRVPAIATVNPIAGGSEWKQGSPYVGTFNLGNTQNPDIVAEGDKVTYEVTNPTNFPNAAYGTTWTVNTFTFTTVNGTPVPTGHYTRTNPSGTNNFKVEYTPILAWTDSLVRMTVNIRRLDNGCDTSFNRIIFVAPRPDPDFSATAGCLGERTLFTNNSRIQSGTMSYIWDFGDGNGSTLVNPIHLYAQPGTYNVKLIAISNFGYRDSITRQVSVYELPAARFTFTNACEGNALTFRDVSTLPTGTPSYLWDFGDGTTNNTSGTPSKTYATPGVYSVNMTVTVNGCSHTFQRWVTQAPRARVNFTNSVASPGCENDEVTFINSSSVSSGTIGYIWDFGDGNQSSIENPKHKYSRSGTFDVILTATTDQGCIDTRSTTISIKESPVAAFNAPSGCNDQQVSFTNSSTAPAGQTNNYVWEFGDGRTSTTANPVHTYGSFGVYNVRLNVVSSNGCTGMTESSVTVAIRPTASFFAEPVCQGNPTIFTNTTVGTGNISHNWDFGNGSTSTDLNPNITFANSGNFNVTLISGIGACTDTATAVITVNPVPTANPTAASNLDGDGTVSFTANANGGSIFLWVFGDGGSSTLPNPKYRYLTPSLYYARLTVRNSEGCSFTSPDIRVFINATEVSEVLSSMVSVFPNPTAGKVTIDAGTAKTNNWKLSLTTIAGMELIKIDNQFNDGKMEIDLSSLAQGVYLIKIDEAGAQSVFRISVIK